MLVNGILRQPWRGYWQLMRADKPIGIYLLLWPTVWALLFAAQGLPSLHVGLVFVLGVVVMRSAGCVINDYADRHVDGLVERTNQRPLVTGLVSGRQALGLFAALVLLAFLLVLTLNWQTIALSVVALVLASLYPFMKRYTYLPQFVLGAAFSWAIPMAFMAIQQQLPHWMWLLYLANLTWTVAYDTQYAMVDRDDDIKAGVKSTARLFGQYDKLIIGLLQLGTCVLWVLIGWLQDLSFSYWVSICMAASLFWYQQRLLSKREKQQCFQAFLNNHWVGLVIALGLFGHFVLT